MSISLNFFVVGGGRYRRKSRHVLGLLLTSVSIETKEKRKKKRCESKDCAKGHKMD